ncbi:MAG: TIGR04282 family arsenosugar biosynthesis glycosyltransferase [Cyanobium sp.]
MSAASMWRHPRQLVVMARWPAPGRCKSRLAVGTGPRSAAAIQARLTGHTLAAARQLGSLAAAAGVPAPEVVLALDGLGRRGAQRWRRALAADRIRLQGRGSLAVRLRRQLTLARREGARAVVVVGSDLPSLEASDLLAAFEALEQVPLVLGPASDGGYWLIGLAGAATAARGPAIRLLCGGDGAIAWGSERVLAQTLAAAVAAGLPWRLLAERNDLDRADDLRAWR